MELFEDYGIHALADGQYGSTGKGALAAWLAIKAAEESCHFDGVFSNAGPNSGHTFYHNGEKHVLKQLPTFAVQSYLIGRTMPVYLTGGAIIDLEVLFDEAVRYPLLPIYVHPNAAVITNDDKAAEHSGSVAAVAGTRSGTGSVLARKVLRDEEAVFNAVWGRVKSARPVPSNIVMSRQIPYQWSSHRYFLEVSQGFSLGINSMFYPKTTSRECTIAQGVADAGLPPQSVTRSYLSFRTFPIRVGNVDGHSSGEWYVDQKETSWEALGKVPEKTTVTNRIRRVATFSMMQFEDACRANCPDFVFLNFLNYLQPHDALQFINRIRMRLDIGMGFFKKVGIITGRGAESKDISLYD